MVKTKSFKAVFIRRALILTALCALTLPLTTCETLQALLPEPIVTLRSVELVNVTFTGIEILCKVNVENRTALEIPVPDFDWELFINANPFVKGAIESGGSMKSRQTNIVEIPVSLGYVDIFNAFQSLKGGRTADYSIALGAKLNIPVIGEKIWNFVHNGILPVLQIPKFSAPSMKIDSIDFSQVQLAFSINVENPNDFEIPSPQLLYDFFINRSEYNSGVTVSSAPLAAAAVTPVVIALTLRYTDLFRAVSGLINLGEAPGLVALRGGFGIPAFADETVRQEITGVIPILKPPSISFRGISVKDYSLTKIDFELSWEIENNNNFAMNVSDLSYNFAVNNSQWSSGKVPGSPRVSPNSKTVVALEFSLNNLAIVSEIINIITRGTNIAYTMNGNLSLGADIASLPNYQTPFNFAGNTSLTR